MISPDEYQKAVIDSDDKDVMVVSGAGSGKTFTMISKIRRLVEEKGIDPSRILVLTFTRVAAEEMRKRYIESQSSNYDNTPDFFTFHGFCYHVIQSFPRVHSVLGYSRVPIICDDRDIKKYQYKAKSMSSCKLSDRKLSKPDVLSMSERMQYEDYRRALNRVLKRNNVIGYDTLSSSVCNLFYYHDSCVRQIENNYLYVFVDEFQDTDDDQFRFIESMSSSNRTLFGDALQNIYQFRGCYNKPMKSIIKSDDWKKFVIPVNYRSSSNICSYVNDMSSKFSSSEFRVELKSKKEGPEVISYSPDNKYWEEVAHYLDDGFFSGSTAILCRTNFESERMTSELRSHGVKVSNKKSNQYLIDLVESCLSDDTCKSWLEFNLSDRDINSYKYSKSQGLSDLMTDKYPSICQNVEDINVVKSIEYAGSDIRTKQFQLCDIFGVDEPNYEMDSGKEVLTYILNRLYRKPKRQTTYVGTIHSVKGLEFDNVIVFGVGGKHFGVRTEEEENLLYTACTRAKNRLIVLRSKEKEQ